MKSVESITTGLTEATTHIVNAAKEVSPEKELSVATTETREEVLFEEEINEEEKPGPAVAAVTAMEDKILEKGMDFLENLAQVLHNPESRQRLANQVTEKDAATGKVYLKIPVSDTQIVENALKMFLAAYSIEWKNKYHVFFIIAGANC